MKDECPVCGIENRGMYLGGGEFLFECSGCEASYGRITPDWKVYDSADRSHRATIAAIENLVLDAKLWKEEAGRTE